MSDAKQLALDFLQAFWDGDPARGVALCAPDAVWTFQKSLREPRYAAIADAIVWLNSVLVAGFDPGSGYEVEVRNAIGEGDEAAIEYSARGKTVRGDIYHNDYLVRFTVSDGKITSVRPYFDTHYVHRVLAPLDDQD